MTTVVNLDVDFYAHFMLTFRRSKRQNPNVKSVVLYLPVKTKLCDAKTKYSVDFRPNLITKEHVLI